MVEQQSTARMERAGTIDLLRLFAAMSVVLFHYVFRGPASGEQLTVVTNHAELFKYGYMGVNLFFVISGFVIAWSAEGRTFEKFAVARVARLYPAFIVGVLATFAFVAAFDDGRFNVTVTQLLANFTMVSPALGQPFMDGVYWSIVLEIIFYFWVALFILLGVFERWKLGIITVWMAISAFDRFVHALPGGETLFLTRYGPYFAAGVLIYELYFKTFSWRAAALLVVSIGLSTTYIFADAAYFQDNYAVLLEGRSLVVLNLLVFWIMIAAVEWRDRIKATPLVLMLGGLTYPLYLLHQHIGYLAIDLLAVSFGGWGAVLVVIAFMLAGSWAVWRFIEPAGRALVYRFAGPVINALGGLLRKAMTFIPLRGGRAAADAAAQ